MKKGTNPKKYNKRKKKTRTIRPESLLTIALILASVFYCCTRIGLNSYNITLSVEEQKLAAEVNRKQDEIYNLKTDISTLQDKNRMLGLVDEDLSENQDNVYVIND